VNALPMFRILFPNRIFIPEIKSRKQRIKEEIPKSR
jgi:hypothetical protein